MHLSTASSPPSHTDTAPSHLLRLIRADPTAACFVRHVGWIFSVLLAIMACRWGISVGPAIALWATAADAAHSDLLDGGSNGDTNFCGNFGLLLLDKASAKLVRPFLETMVRVTMMRGAQSAGLVTYFSYGKAAVGMRKRVSNGKRTDLCNLLMEEVGWYLHASKLTEPQLFVGHTRFATSSTAALPGAHPHQWSPPTKQCYWVRSNVGYDCHKVNHENYITHNGDLDFYEWHGILYPLVDVFRILKKVLHVTPTATVDSLAVAGLLDLLRTKGMWPMSVRYGYVFGGLKDAGNLMSAEVRSSMWNVATLDTISGFFEMQWRRVLSTEAPTMAVGEVHMRDKMLNLMLEAIPSIDFKLPVCAGEGAAVELVHAAVNAFFDQDLYMAAQKLLRHAEGSFGLCLSTAVDSASEIVIGARGQSMSIAFW